MACNAGCATINIHDKLRWKERKKQRQTPEANEKMINELPHVHHDTMIHVVEKVLFLFKTIIFRIGSLPKLVDFLHINTIPPVLCNTVSI